VIVRDKTTTIPSHLAHALTVCFRDDMKHF
jgi:hypothetical protein